MNKLLRQITIEKVLPMIQSGEADVVSNDLVLSRLTQDRLLFPS